MATAVAAPSQHKQASRKGKAAWRKNIDISAIQDGIEAVREETTKYGAPTSTLPSSALFTTDPTPSQQNFITDTTPSQTLHARALKHHKPLKADQILALRSATPALSTHVPSASNKYKRPTISRAKRAHLLALANGAASRPGGLVEAGFTAPVIHDVWDEAMVDEPDPAGSKQLVTAEATEKATDLKNVQVEKAKDEPPEHPFDFLPKPTAIKKPKTLSHKPISQILDGSILPAVRAPGQAKSYNPLFTAYSDSLISAGEQEVAAELKRLSEARKQEELDRKRALTIESDGHRMGGEFRLGATRLDSDDDEESEWEGFLSGAEDGDAAMSKKMPKRKTKAERNKILRRKEAERAQVAARNEARARREQAETIRELSSKRKRKAGSSQPATDLIEPTPPAESALIPNAEPLLPRQTDLQHIDDGPPLKLRSKTLGPAPHPRAPLEVVLPDELRDSLRLLRPEGDLMGERYRSLLVRGKIESRKAAVPGSGIGRDRKKGRVTEKWSYKDWTL